MEEYNISDIIVSNVAEFKAALRQAGKGISIKLKPGTYTMDGVTIPNSYTEISSLYANNRAVIRMSNSATSYILIASNKSGLGFYDLIFDGNFSNQPGQSRGHSDNLLVQLKYCSYITIENCDMVNGASDGFNFYTCSNITVDECTCDMLGHDTLYFRYNCANILVQNCDFVANTNSCLRVSYGGTNIKVLNNTFRSKIYNGSTGPLNQYDKRNVKNLLVKGNTFKTANGSGIWLCGDQTSCTNVIIEDNVFDKVGHYLNGKLDYNGYSNGYICGMGFSGVIIRRNTMKNCLFYGIVQNEDKHTIPGNYTWIMEDNVIEAKTALRLDSTRGHITGSNNKITCTTLCQGYSKNLDLSTTSEPVEQEDDQTEPTTNEEGVDMEVAHTFILKGKTIKNGKAVELVHKTYKDEAPDEILSAGQSLPYELKIRVDGNLYYEIKGTATLRKI